MRQRTVGRGGGTLLRRVCSVVLVLGMTAGPRAADVPEPPELIVLPPGDKVLLQVGDSRRFSVTVTTPTAEYRWSLDGKVVSRERQWEYRPEGADIGTHRVDVTVLLGPAASRRSWSVVVEPPPMPEIVESEPRGSLVRVEAGERVTFRYRLESSIAADRVDVRWTIDGEPAGVGTVLAVTGEEGPPRRIRAVASSLFGVVQAREWRLETGAGMATAEAPPPDAVPPDEELAALVRELPPEEPVAPPTTIAPKRAPSTAVAKRPESTTTTTGPPEVVTPSTVRVAKRASTTSTLVQVAKPASTTSTLVRVAKPASTTSTLVRVVMPAATTSTLVQVARRSAPTTLPPPPPVSKRTQPSVERAEVEALLERYARAYETRDVDELRRIGQVRTDEQAKALERYFDRVHYVDVAIEVLGVETSAPPSVRFRRRDRFHDPSGRLVDEESPEIEKRLERSPDGLRFAPRS